MDISKKMRELRGETTQEEFAKRLGVSLKTVQNYEYGKTSPTVEFLEHVSNELGISFLYFFDLSDNNNNIGSGRARSENKRKNITTASDVVRIPYYPNLSASAGFGAINEEQVSVETRELTRGFLKSVFGITNNYDKTFILKSRLDYM